MNCTSEPYRIKSKNLIDGIRMMLEQLRVVNAEAVTQLTTNQASVEQMKAQHEQTIAHLLADNEELQNLVMENETFIQDIEKLLSDKTEPTA